MRQHSRDIQHKSICEDGEQEDGRRSRNLRPRGIGKAARIPAAMYLLVEQVPGSQKVVAEQSLRISRLEVHVRVMSGPP
jgi:hypothetical protein